ncbi:hypothetical protein HPB52_011002 [Rhipicephalus sanguineus]|uniref:THAP-type domain-containing protein n=1 Tax=Rhipicephalus sanguineus TaxID=34632 RepID=A0A9D4T0H3_RHISA|nr:hypothetical protein HPB52_011002 [Rhipicephalus sanguineus]
MPAKVFSPDFRLNNGAISEQTLAEGTPPCARGAQGRRTAEKETWRGHVIDRNEQGRCACLLRGLAMPQFCAAYSCCNTFGRDEVDLHKFPLDHKMAAKWVTGVTRKDFKPTRASVLCSKHFRVSDYVRSPSLMQSLGLTIKSMRVSSDAVPYVFPHLRGPSPRT